MKKLAFILAITTVTGCATTAPTQYYRAAGETEQISITGKYSPMAGFNGTIIIAINNETVINTKLPFGSSFELAGTFNNKSVDAVCSKLQATVASYPVKCLVLIDNERAATLSF